MDILRFYQDYGVNYVTERHKHARSGWINTACPWCTGNPGYHLGYNLLGRYFFCWRCGWHPVVETLSKLIGTDKAEIRKVLPFYGMNLAFLPAIEKKETKKHLEFPLGTKSLSTEHRLYLEKRGFDSKLIEQIYDLRSTGPISILNGVDYKNRILIPYYWNGKIVSFDTRSISKTASHETRYRACPKEFELIPHKEILYGKQEEWRETGILVEGPTDVWRMGTSSFAVSGIQTTPRQIRLLAKMFKRMAVIYDDDPQAVLQANKIVAELRFRGVDAFRVDVPGDPGSMKQEDANYLVKQLI